MANRTNKKKRDLLNPLQSFIIEQQTKEIEELRFVIQEHEAARTIETERLKLASERANIAEDRVKALELAASIEFGVFPKGEPNLGVCSEDVITCAADPGQQADLQSQAVFYRGTPVVKVPSDADREALARGEYVDVSSPPGTGDSPDLAKFSVSGWTSEK